MFLRLLPAGIGEALLFLVLVAALLFVVRAVRRRHRVADRTGGRADGGVVLPSLDTQQRVTGTLQRIRLDRIQGAWLADVVIGTRRLALAVTDYAAQRERYRDLIGKKVDLAIYALATLAPGGAEAMRDQIRDFDAITITPELVRLVPAGQFANDAVAIARVLSHRDDELTDGTTLTIYRCEVVRAPDFGLVVEMGVPRDPATGPTDRFADGEMVHGAARLYGYLAPVA
jgi:hypothetical protein